MDKNQKTIFFKLQVFKLDDLPWFYKYHGAILMVIFCAAIQYDARFYLFKTDHIKIGCKFFVAKQACHITPV